MIRNFSFLAVALLLSAPSQAAECDSRAITLPLTDVRLGGQTFIRGVELGIGSPEEKLSAMLCAAHTSTYVYGAEGYCNKKRHWCFVGHGGKYNQSLSATSRDSDAPVAPFIDNDVTTNWTTDSIALGNNASLPDFRLGVPTYQLHKFQGQGEIGVAVNSTFINALHTAGNISSNVYSLFWGDDFTDEPRDGSLTLGGYDESIMGDSMVTKGFTQGDSRCREGMIVEVTDMKLNNQDGSMVDLLEGLGLLNVCIVPSLRAVMAIPRAYGEKLIESMGAVRLDNGTNMAGSTTNTGGRLMPHTPILEPDSASFIGNLSVTLQDNVTVNFTDNQLLIRRGDPYLDLQGDTQYNASRVGLTVLSMSEDASQMARIGGMFFSSAYMMVNHDKSEFSIAPARRKFAEPRLVGVNTANNCVAYLNGTVPGRTVTSSSPLNPGNSGDSASSLSIGAIAGIAVGSAVAIILVAVVAFLLWRRRRRGNKHVPPPTIPTEEPTKRPYVFEKRGQEVYEAPDQRGGLKMNADERADAVELDGNPQPSELPHQT